MGHRRSPVAPASPGGASVTLIIVAAGASVPPPDASPVLGPSVAFPSDGGLARSAELAPSVIIFGPSTDASPPSTPPPPLVVSELLHATNPTDNTNPTTPQVRQVSISTLLAGLFTSIAAPRLAHPSSVEA